MKFATSLRTSHRKPHRQKLLEVYSASRMDSHCNVGVAEYVDHRSSKAPAFVLINKESRSQVSALPRTPIQNLIAKSRGNALVSSSVDHLVDCGPDQAQPTDHNHRQPQSESSGPNTSFEPWPRRSLFLRCATKRIYPCIRTVSKHEIRIHGKEIKADL